MNRNRIEQNVKMSINNMDLKYCQNYQNHTMTNLLFKVVDMCG